MQPRMISTLLIKSPTISYGNKKGYSSSKFQCSYGLTRINESTGLRKLVATTPATLLSPSVFINRKLTCTFLSRRMFQTDRKMNGNYIQRFIVLQKEKQKSYRVVQ